MTRQLVLWCGTVPKEEDDPIGQRDEHLSAEGVKFFDIFGRKRDHSSRSDWKTDCEK
jgi:hypothetical protein